MSLRSPGASGQQPHHTILQLRDPERLRYKIITACFQTKLSIFSSIQTGDSKNQNVSISRIVFQSSGQFEPIYLGHPHVHENQAWSDVPELVQGVPRVARTDHGPPNTGERASQ